MRRGAPETQCKGCAYLCGHQLEVVDDGDLECNVYRPTAEEKWLPEKQTGLAVLAYLAGAIVPLIASVTSAFRLAVVSGATITTFAALGLSVGGAGGLYSVN